MTRGRWRWPIAMLLLYIVLVLSTLAVIGVAVAFYWRVRRHSQRQAALPDETAVLRKKHPDGGA